MEQNTLYEGDSQSIADRLYPTIVGQLKDVGDVSAPVEIENIKVVFKLIKRFGEVLLMASPADTKDGTFLPESSKASNVAYLIGARFLEQSKGRRPSQEKETIVSPNTIQSGRE